MDSRSLLDKRVLVVLGKGGTGKSTLCATLAFLAAEQGKRVLIVQSTSKEIISYFFGHREVGYVEQEVYRNIKTANLYPQQAVLEEFLRVHIRFRGIYKRLFRSPVYKYTVQAIPGLKELLTIGKVMVYEGMRDERANRPLYDLIILDAPATGHVVSFLQVPMVAMETVSFGPLYKNSKAVFDLLADPQKTSCCIVTLPEEMAVNETCELYEAITKELKLSVGSVFMNQMITGLFGDKEEKAFVKKDLKPEISRSVSRLTGNPELAEAMLESLDSYLRRHKLCEFFLNDLRGRLEVEPVIIPYLYRDDFKLDAIKEIARVVKPFVAVESNSGKSP
jgi:anion-transporting  ArsA/GET3 family ATPase